MSGLDADATSVRYTAKELFARIDMKLDVIAAQLIAKADHDELLALEVRVATLEAAANEQRGFDRAKAAIAALVVAVVGLAVPLALRLIG